MNALLQKYLSPLREGEGGGAGGAAAQQPAGGSGGGGAAAAADASKGAGGGQSSASQTPAPYRPEGLPDDVFGASDKDTIDKLFAVNKGYRQRDSEQRGVPEKVDAYHTFDVDKMVTDKTIDASLKPFIAELADEPIMKTIAAHAFEKKWPVGVVQDIVAVAFGAAQKEGILEAPVDQAAERGKLLPEGMNGKPKADQDKAIDARLQANIDWLTLMAAPGADGKAKLDKGVAEHAMLMLMDTAAGNQFIEWARGLAEGGGTGPNAGGGSGGGNSKESQREQLRERSKAPEVTFGHRLFDRAKWDALQEDYKKLGD